MKRIGFIVGLVALAIVLGVLIARRLGGVDIEDRSTAIHDAETPRSEVPAEGDTSAELLTKLKEERVGSATMKGDGRSETVVAADKGDASANDLTALQDLGDEFTATDIPDAARPVVLIVENCRVSVGEEAEVAIRMTGPSLENFCLYMNYDPELIEVVPGSAQKSGTGFRTGLEFYARVKDGVGEAALINETRPGSRNLNPTQDEVVATFRVRGMAEGTSVLSFPLGKSSFTTAVGEDVSDVQILGGRVEVRVGP